MLETVPTVSTGGGVATGEGDGGGGGGFKTLPHEVDMNSFAVVMVKVGPWLS